MKARILPVDEIAEYSTTDTVVLMISISPLEADQIIDVIKDYGRWARQRPERSVSYLVGILETIVDRSVTHQDVANTDGRYLAKISRHRLASVRAESRPDGQTHAEQG